MNKVISKRIKELRVRKGFTQEELSEETGLSLRTIQRIENGETEPLGDSIKKIAQVFNVTPDDIIDWTIIEDNFFLKALNLSTLTFLFFPILGILVPFIMWSTKKDKIKGINEIGRDIVNFQITWNLIFYLGLFLIIITVFSFPAFIDSVFSFNVASSAVIQQLFTKVFTLFMYTVNFIFVLFNTLLIHTNSATKYYPKIKFMKV